MVLFIGFGFNGFQSSSYYQGNLEKGVWIRIIRCFSIFIRSLFIDYQTKTKRRSL